MSTLKVDRQLCERSICYVISSPLAFHCWSTLIVIVTCSFIKGVIHHRRHGNDFRDGLELLTIPCKLFHHGVRIHTIWMIKRYQFMK